MPNGRTHIFEVPTEKLIEFLGLDKAEGPIGYLFDSPGSPDVVRVSLSDLLDRVLQHKVPEITIEEQHWCEYIIHVSHFERGWVCVDRDSPVFPSLRRLHLNHRLPKR